MNICRENKNVLLKLRDPYRVINAIPTAIYIRSSDRVAVEHNSLNTTILNNLGIDVPAPILSDYKWPGIFKPFKHQKETAAFLTLNNRALVLNEIGTGKTQAALWAADYLMEKGDVNRCLILAPLSTLERVWGDAIFTNFIDRKSVALTGAASRRHKLMLNDAEFHIVNHDGFAVISAKASGLYDLIIVDEAAVFRNPMTKRSMLFRKWVAKHSPRLWMMTGTPTPNGPPDAWSLSMLLENPHCPTSFYKFRDKTMRKLNQYTFVPRPEATDIVNVALQPAIRYTRNECFDLPPTTYQTREVPLSDQQKKHHNEMMRKFITEFECGTKITAGNERVKVQKLLQIACGAIYSADGSAVELDCKSRINQTADIIEESGGKVLVFTPFIVTLNMLYKELSKRYTVNIVNGKTPRHERDKTFLDFQNEENPRVILAHPGTMSHGLTLTQARSIIWYGPINSNDLYTQANGRTERIGKKFSSCVVHIQSTDLEQYVFSRLLRKQKLQGVLLDLIQSQTARCTT